MDKLEVGMYVRTFDGYIAKLLHYGYNAGISGKSHLFDSQIIDNSYTVYENDNFLFDSQLKKYVKKFSHNPIDLIEVGDYVNGYKVESDDFLGKHIVIFEAEERKYKRMYLGRINIDNIVTKEQFDSMKYEIGG